MESGHQDAVQLLLETRRVDVKVKDNVGQTPRSWAARNEHEALARYLLAWDLFRNRVCCHDEKINEKNLAY